MDRVEKIILIMVNSYTLYFFTNIIFFTKGQTSTLFFYYKDSHKYSLLDFQYHKVRWKNLDICTFI